jgi:hypothetical protein
MLGESCASSSSLWTAVLDAVLARVAADALRAAA